MATVEAILQLRVRSQQVGGKDGENSYVRDHVLRDLRGMLDAGSSVHGPVRRDRHHARMLGQSVAGLAGAADAGEVTPHETGLAVRRKLFDGTTVPALAAHPARPDSRLGPNHADQLDVVQADHVRQRRDDLTYPCTRLRFFW
ncbi:hypothetical protein [Amycolatopsis sp. CA-230715]|uniref:hypothetical protein n=1 Tax=Amycolatopsis sp. CA-230715 TaxID=2745196 RepID=UPI001C0142E2|nr:hypothetical protein [Amycolatopsis sp. CA-230715]